MEGKRVCSTLLANLQLMMLILQLQPVGRIIPTIADASIPDEAAAECALRELRCDLLCHYNEMREQCDTCRSRRPMRFGKRIKGDSEAADERSRLAVTVSASRGSHHHNLPVARVQLVLPADRSRNPKDICICCEGLTLACLLRLPMPHIKR